MIAALLLSVLLALFSASLGAALLEAKLNALRVRPRWWNTEHVIASGLFAACALVLLLLLFHFAQMRP